MKKLLFGRVLSCTIFVLKQRALHSTSKQLTGKKGFVALRFFRKNFTWPIATFTWPIIPFICTNFTLSHYYPPPGPQVLPPSALLITTPLRLQVLPPSAEQPAYTSVSPSHLYWWSWDVAQMWDSIFCLQSKSAISFIAELFRLK